MPQTYKQSYVVVMESGRLVRWTGYAQDRRHGEGLAVEHAQKKFGGQVWDVAARPVK